MPNLPAAPAEIRLTSSPNWTTVVDQAITSADVYYNRLITEEIIIILCGNMHAGLLWTVDGVSESLLTKIKA